MVVVVEYDKWYKKGKGAKLVSIVFTLRVKIRLMHCNAAKYTIQASCLIRITSNANNKILSTNNH